MLAFSEESSGDVLNPTLTRAISSLNAAENALISAREVRKSAPDLAEFEAKELACWRERSRARRAVLVAARLLLPNQGKSR